MQVYNQTLPRGKLLMSIHAESVIQVQTLRNRANRITLDIGGEGRRAAAINLNRSRYKTLGPHRGDAIPRLIVGRADAIPLADDSVARVVVERTPLSTAALAEIARVVVPGGVVILAHVPLERGDRHARAIDALAGFVQRRSARLFGQSVQVTRIRLAVDDSH
jgi:ubiquinone/menaquinone biosynthesis C-methylase UbiE